jgi:hypothetical protein
MSPGEDERPGSSREGPRHEEEPRPEKEERETPPQESPPPSERVFHCDLCGTAMLNLHCKLICEQCGYTRDCSDP